MIYEEDAEEWALYLREVFLNAVKREAILLYCLENYCLWDLELLDLNSYKCKLLILSNSLLKNLTPKKCQFLESVLHLPESVVTLLCGVKSSDQFYKSLNISRGRWELSTEQEAEDYISVIKSIIFKGSVAKSYFFISLLIAVVKIPNFYTNEYLLLGFKKKRKTKANFNSMLYFPQNAGKFLILALFQSMRISYAKHG